MSIISDFIVKPKPMVAGEIPARCFCCQTGLEHTYPTCVAIAGFVFGLFGTFTKTATVSLGAAACNDAGGACTMSFTNTGNANTATSNVCSETFGGVTYPDNTGRTVAMNSGSSGTVTCTLTTPTNITPGESVSGLISLTNGGSVLFSGSA